VSSYFAAQVRIADELQRSINLASWLRESIENELNASFGVGKNGEPPKCGVDVKAVQKFRDVVKALEAITACKIKLDANAKKMAEAMSPEEELAAVKAYIRSLEPGLRGAFLRGELTWHSSPSGGKGD
jgi:hypothetical protein